MWRNYLTVAFRAFTKNRTYAAINVVGLATGLAACLLLLVYVRYETSYDRWLPAAERVFQLQTIASDSETGEDRSLQQSQYVAGTALAKDFPQVERKVFVLSGGVVALLDGEPVTVEGGLYVDAPFLDIVQLPLVRGDPATVLANAGDMVLSETEARRFFGNEDAVGRTLTLIEGGQRVDYRISGVLKDLPRNSHMRASFIVRFDPVTDFASFPDFLTSWGQISGYNYVLLRPGADVAAIHSAMPAWERRNIPPSTTEGADDIGARQDWRLANVPDVHLGPVSEGSMTPSNDRGTIATFLIVALLVLGMACVNFTNLATARAGQRAREVALRKVMGAARKQLVVQFLGESILVVAIAMLIALALAELMVPFLSAYLNADLRMPYFGEGGILLPALAIVLVVGALGGLYPALYLSRYQPGRVLKANQSAAEPHGVGLIRGALVVAQFSVSIGLIICTVVVYAQTVYARTADPGFRREGLLQVSGLSRPAIAPLQEALVRQVAALDGVTSVGRTGIGIDTPNNMGRSVYLPGRTEPINIGNYPVDEGFFRTMGIELLAGRSFDASRPADRFEAPFTNVDPAQQRALVARGANAVINELAARELGFRTPEEAIGKQVQVAQFMDPDAGRVPVTIVGVVKDTRFRSMHRSIEPILYRLADDVITHMVVRYDTSQPSAVRERIGQVWKRVAPDVPFEAEFSEDIVRELYDAEQARAEAFAGFAVLAIVIACLGLFGLAAFTAERRTKEIGIRKVFGARVRDIVKLLAWQFSKPVVIANLIAWPAAWWLMRNWLNGFDERVPLTPAPFVLAGLVALVIAIGTIAGHAIKVARAHPIHALRYE
jgi:putative ABC transport system permease protein